MDITAATAGDFRTLHRMLRQPVISASGGLYCALRAQLYPYRGYIDRVRGRLYFTATVGGDITCRRQISPEHREDLTHAIGVDITAATAGDFRTLHRMLRQPVISASGGLYCALRAQLYPYRGYIDRSRGRLFFRSHTEAII